MERINTYEKWLEKEGLPVIRDYGVFDLLGVPLQPWPRKGGRGVYLNLGGAEGQIDAYLCEIPPGKALLPQRHLYEELIYVLRGYGATSVWVEGSPKQSFEWQEGSLFSIPLNAWHQHFNGQSDKPVRYIGLTRAPVIMNLFHDLDFVFHNDYIFKTRFGGEADYFSSKGRELNFDGNLIPKIWESNFIPDCRSFQLADDPKRGGIARNVRFELTNGLMSAHIAEFLGGTYVKAHHHGPGAHLICLHGQGYTLLWPYASGIMAEGAERIKIDWQENSVVSIPGDTFHQHFSIGKETTRLLAFHAELSEKFKGIRKDYEGQGRQSIKKGGTVIEHEDEDPAVRRLFRGELAKTGAPWLMSKYFPGE